MEECKERREGGNRRGEERSREREREKGEEEEHGEEERRFQVDSVGFYGLGNVIKGKCKFSLGSE